MSSAVSNSSARRRRSAQPKVQERAAQERVIREENKSNNDFATENIPILGMKESIYFLSNKIQVLENVLKTKLSNDPNPNETTNTVQDIKRTLEEMSIKQERLELSIGKMNLVLQLHDTYINKIKNMVEFENVEKVEPTEITPQLLDSN